MIGGKRLLDGGFAVRVKYHILGGLVGLVDVHDGRGHARGRPVADKQAAGLVQGGGRRGGDGGQGKVLVDLEVVHLVAGDDITPAGYYTLTGP